MATLFTEKQKEMLVKSSTGARNGRHMEVSHCEENEIGKS